MTFLQTTQAQSDDATSKSEDFNRVLSDRGEKKIISNMPGITLEWPDAPT